MHPSGFRTCTKCADADHQQLCQYLSKTASHSRPPPPEKPGEPQKDPPGEPPRGTLVPRKVGAENPPGEHPGEPTPEKPGEPLGPPGDPSETARRTSGGPPAVARRPWRPPSGPDWICRHKQVWVSYFAGTKSSQAFVLMTSVVSIVQGCVRVVCRRLKVCSEGRPVSHK